MKRIVFFASALALTASLFAQGIETRGRTDLPADTEAGVPPITPSRSINLKGGQYLDVVYPGTGWIYLGEMEGSSLLKYEKRETGEGDTFFTLLARGAGSATLHFYKSDALAGSYIDDYLSVTVSGTSRNAEHVEAPSYADIVPPRPSFTKSTVVAQAQMEKALEAAAAQKPSPVREQASGSQSTQPGYAQAQEDSGSSKDDRAATVIQTSEGSVTMTPPAATNAPSSKTSESSATKTDSNKEDTSSLSEEEIIALARTAYESKDYELSLSYLEDFFDKAASLRDEGLYLKGRVLEAPSSSRNIKEALASYKAVVSNYPESDLWDEASKRISYIERIYLEIR